MLKELLNKLTSTKKNHAQLKGIFKHSVHLCYFYMPQKITQPISLTPQKIMVHAHAVTKISSHL